MGKRIFIAGGYGLIGSQIAKHVRRISRDVEIILAGRHPEQGNALAQQIGGARTVYLDLDHPQTLENIGQVDLIVAALHDPADHLLQAAIHQQIAYVNITQTAGDLAPLLFPLLQSQSRGTIVLLGHSDGGVNTIVAKKAAADFDTITSVQVASLYDVLDPIGPMNASDFDNASGLSDRVLLRQKGTWSWVEAAGSTRQVHVSEGVFLDGYPIPLLDVPSIAGFTHADTVRWDYVQGESIGTQAGRQASHDIYIDIEGVLPSGDPAIRRIMVSDPNGQAHLTGLGISLAVERVLGLDGQPPVQGGIYMPETLISPDRAIQRLGEAGVDIKQVVVDSISYPGKM